MWGSAAYLTSSALQWYESVNKHAPEDDEAGPDES
jgi:hypothetical protein